MQLTRLRTLSLLGLFAVACAGNDSSTVLVVASQGGTVQAGAVTITIPANALANDTEVTVRIDSLSNYPALPDGLQNVAVIEPAGTMLSAAATVTFEPGSTVSAGAYLSLRQLSSGAWYPPEISSATVNADGDIVAEVWSFETIAVIESLGAN